MKPSARTFRIQWDVHAWLGVIASLGLFVIFYFGTFTLFREELTVWQAPPPPGASPTCSFSWEARFAQLDAQLNFPKGARFMVSGAREACRVRGWFYDPAAAREGVAIVDLRSGRDLARHSRLADELYDMHFVYRLPYGLELSGVLALSLFCLLVTGFVIHVSNLRRQWWQFRSALRWRFSASDAHKVLGVFGTPFVLLFAWSGAVFGLAAPLMSFMGEAVYAGDQAKAAGLYYGPDIEREARPADALRLSLDVLVERARAVSKGPTEVVQLRGGWLGTEAGFVRVTFARQGLDAERSLVLDAATARVLATQAEESSPFSRFNRSLFDLHFANYGGFALRAAYALLSLFVCVVIVTGNVIWLERRDPSRRHVGNRLLEGATIGMACGANLGTAAYFFANRALPAGSPERATLEFQIFLGVWSACFIASALFGARARWLGRWASALAGCLYALIAVTDLFRNDRSAGLADGEPRALLSTDGLLLIFAIVSWAAAWFLRSRSEAQALAAPSS
jgi:uncharacterized iron-regulated membrane protein